MPTPKAIDKLPRKPSLLENIAYVYGTQIIVYALPLVTIPYLTHILGPSGWGFLALAQGLGQYISLMVEYGFALSATREVARNRENRDALGTIVASVTAAKGILALISLIAVALVQAFYPPLQHQQSLLWGAYAWGVVQGFSFLWFFQAIEQLRAIAMYEMVSRCVAAAAIFLFVRKAEDVYLVLVLQGAAALIPVLAGAWMCRRFIGGIGRWHRHVLPGLRLGWSMFVFRGSVSLYTYANNLILGMFAPAAIVGFYSGAERLSRSLLALVTPVQQVLFARQSHEAVHSKAALRSNARKALLAMIIVGFGLSAAAFFGAPLMVRILLGESFTASIQLIRILAILPLLISVGNAFGQQWLLPHGRDYEFNAVILLAGVINVVAALLLVRRYSAEGMCWAVVLAEFFVTAGFAVLAIRSGFFQKHDPELVPLPKAVHESN